MTCVKRLCNDGCFYCDANVKRHEHDHAPVPERHGGTETVAACPTCHHLKDRAPYESWPQIMAVTALKELVELGAIPQPWTAREWPDYWDDLSQHARLLWAKMAAVALDIEDIGIRRSLALAE